MTRTAQKRNSDTVTCSTCYRDVPRHDAGVCLAQDGEGEPFIVCDDCRQEDDYEWCDKCGIYHPGDCRVKGKPKMRNPIPQNGTRIGDAQELYQKFHGKPSTQTVEVEHKVIVREHLSQLGILNEMTLHLVTGDKVVLSFVNEGPESIILAASPDGKQLYLEGGDQSLDLGKLKLSGAQWVRDIMVIGILKKLQYRTRKGFDDFELIDYYHRLGEETKVEPVLIYDNLNETMLIAGGQYEIKDVGIVN